MLALGLWGTRVCVWGAGLRKGLRKGQGLAGSLGWVGAGTDLPALRDKGHRKGLRRLKVLRKWKALPSLLDYLLFFLLPRDLWGEGLPARVQGLLGGLPGM